ncbi:2-succinyl-5-enolpyruvyl-6-hydroxy-3-cyclohexene-1-carboxylic-acid synthase [Salinicoccus siamensis]|uniref:2-succinyl-5-enolpyruvyl-6-hydroxy-3-cyclohexene-1-carboxylate synthase n=1 Tax=Salinicoccus siamensis TaxID=381830 RepID=A0ABV5Z0P1_9STAP
MAKDHKDNMTYQVFTLIDLLYAHGVSECVISPGSRSTPLSIAAEMHPGMKTHVHPDERSAAFFALGIAKYSNEPVVLICTSGTAAANYTPAIAEAGLSHVPLVALTADRPHELRDVGAPQSISQEDMYRNYTKYYTELPIADGHLSGQNLLEAKVLQGAQYFYGANRGPVHINVPIREPLMPDLTRTDLFFRSRSETPAQITEAVPSYTFKGSGLVFIGETIEALEGLVPLMENKGLTVITDPRQHIRMKAATVTHHDLLFGSLSEEQKAWLDDEVDFIIRIGDPFTSKALNTFLSQTSIPQYLISEHQQLKTYPKAPEKVFVGSIGHIFRSMDFEGGSSIVKGWFTEIDAAIRDYITAQIPDYRDEGRFMYEMLERLPEDRTLFVSSSMPIRDVERYDVGNHHKILSNRGANGIDGVVSTALGVATKTPVTLIIGDIALYHDMNGLLISKLESIDINIIVFNNNGGGIFGFLPQKQEATHYERLFGTPIDIDFSHAAAMYGFNYRLVEAADAITEDDMSAAGRNIMEIRTDRDANVESHQQLRFEVQEMIQSYGA